MRTLQESILSVVVQTRQTLHRTSLLSISSTPLILSREHLERKRFIIPALEMFKILHTFLAFKLVSDHFSLVANRIPYSSFKIVMCTSKIAQISFEDSYAASLPKLRFIYISDLFNLRLHSYSCSY